MTARPQREHDPRITVIQQELFNENRSQGDKYRELFVGRPGIGALLAYEAAMLLASWVPGALGLVLRSWCYPMILGSVGRNVVFGVNLTLRHPHKIHIGDNVVIDDLCCLDAKGTDNSGITIGNGVFVGRNTILSCKNGDIVIEDRANIGFNCEIFSASRVRVGKDILIAAYTYLVGGDHLYDRTDIPVLQQGRTAKGIDVGDGTWLGTHVVVTDGSTIGRDAIIGAGTKIDNLVHIGHDTNVGKNCLFAGQVGIAGATVIEDGVTLWGQVGVSKTLTIGANAIVYAQSGVPYSLEGNKIYFGSPAEDAQTKKKEFVWVKRIPELWKKVMNDK